MVLCAQGYRFSGEDENKQCGEGTVRSGRGEKGECKANKSLQSPEPRPK